MYNSPPILSSSTVTPDQPFNLTITNRSPISISLIWSSAFNGYAPLVYANVSYQSPNYPQEGTQYQIVPTLYSATLSGLHPNANYSIRVALVNAAGFTSSFSTVQTSTLSLRKSSLFASACQMYIVVIKYRTVGSKDNSIVCHQH